MLPTGKNLLQFSEQKGLVSIYIHVPFCTKKCPYCHFAVRKDSDSEHELWRSATIQDLQKNSTLFQNKTLVSIYFGGGTPTLASPSDIKAILDVILHLATSIHPDMEVTIEANPESLSEQKLTFYRSIGINRLSIGVQSFDDDLLQKLGRTHNSQAALDAIHSARKAGFTNLSIDLMYDIPGQNMASWEKTLSIACNLGIAHLSLYNLTIEPATMFFRQKSALEKLLPTSDESLQMLSMAVQMLENAGLQRYEISAFARNGKFSIHNTGYWLGRDFLGVGPSAFSYLEGRRFCNKLQLPAYARALQENKSVVHFEEKLPFPQNLQETLAVQLRLLQGVRLQELEKSFGAMPVDVIQTLTKLKSEHLLIEENERLKLSEQGLLFYDDVASCII